MKNARHWDLIVIVSRGVNIYERTVWMTMRPIDADNFRIPKGIFVNAISVPSILDMVSQQPTIDPESLRPQGAWIPYHEADFGWDEYGVRCSNCNWKVENDDIKFSMPFCPKCGARMKKDGDA